jgi:hypothetical protein
MKGNNIKVLYLTYHYAPQNTVASFRALKFTKYMPQNNITPYIFTSESGTIINPNLENDIPSIAIVLRKRSNLDTNKIYTLPVASTKNFKTRIKTILRDVFFSPDKYIWWYISSIPYLIRVINKEQIDVIIATGGPFSSNVCAYYLKKICHVPIVLDFRDPWKKNVIFKNQSFIRKLFNSYWEKKCIQNADGIISVTNSILLELKRYKTRARFMEITNGFDLDDFSKIEVKKNMDEFIFLYTGKFSININNYNPDTIIHSFIKFSKSIKRETVKMIFIGNTDDETKNFIDSFDSDCISYYPPMQKDEVLIWQAKADVLVQFYYPENHVDAISMKIFEYIAQGKPIISFNIKQGCLYELLDDYKLGETANSHDISEMTNLFKRAYNNEIKFNTTSNKELIKFDFQFLTKRLSKLLREITEK